MVILVFDLDNIVLIWCVIGVLILIFIFGIIFIFFWIFVRILFFECLLSINGVFILEVFIFKVCLFSLVCLVFCFIVCIFGIERSIFLVIWFILLDFFREILGKVLMFMVNEFLLKGGRKLCLKEVIIINEIIKMVLIVFKIIFLWYNVYCKVIL